ncbi:Ger(x)C family spore germination protein [Alicyclobacillus fodiniaquatilis]|uniref:Ger(X)C family spore germination protein n=1 Tax=Alicyclobacillus fodiniaquatilis TaxID=1661150 RepID=A0ABW4JB53_9BACL
MKQIWTWAVTIVLSAGLTGCWDAHDISDLSPVIAIAVDLTDDGSVQTTFDVPVAESQTGTTNRQKGDSGEQTTTIVGTGRTFEATLEDAARRTSSRLFFPHNMLIVFSEKFASKQGIGDVLNYTERTSQFRENEIIAVTDGEAKQLLTNQTSGESLNPRYLNELTLTDKRTVSSIEVDIINQLLSPSHSALVTWFSKTKGQPEIAGMGAFQGDKLVQLLDQTDSKNLLWLVRPLYDINLYLPVSKSKTASFRVLSTRPSITCRSDTTGRVHMVVHLQGYAQITRMPDGTTLNETNLEKMTDMLNSALQSNIAHAVQKLQATQVDALGMGTLISEKDNAAWLKQVQHWPQHFANLDIRYQVNFRIIRHGMSKNNPLDYYNQEDS